MSKRTHSVLVFSIISLFKFSCFFYLIVLGGFFFSKSDGFFHLKGFIKSFKPKRRVLTLNDVGDPLMGVWHYQPSGYGTEIAGAGDKPQGADIDEVGISRFILELSDEFSSSQADKLARLISEECEKRDLDPLLVLAVIQIESGFYPTAVSHKGAVGLMQVMPATADFVAGKMGISLRNTSLYDPYTNVRLGIYYLSTLVERFDSVEYALTAYNVGPNKNFSKSNSYSRRVLNLRRWLERASVIVAEES